MNSASRFINERRINNMAIPKNYYANVDVKKLGIDDINALSTKVAALDDELNDETDGVVKRVSTLEDARPLQYLFTLEAGETSVTVSPNQLNSTSFIDVGTEVFGVNPTNIEVDGTDITLTFEARDSDLHGCVMIFG
jgi:hypothetical protein